MAETDFAYDLSFEDSRSTEELIPYICFLSISFASFITTPHGAVIKTQNLKCKVKMHSCIDNKGRRFPFYENVKHLKKRKIASEV